MKKRLASKIVAASILIAMALIANAVAKRALRSAPGGANPPNDDVPCGAGFFRRGTRCCPTDEPLAKLGDGLCGAGAPTSCPTPLVATERGCDVAERSVVRVPATKVLVGPSDWEAEGRVRPRVVEAGPFDIDRFEVSVGRAGRSAARDDAARAASHVTLAEARAICLARGGRLPTEDEWIVAAAGDKPRRYPWGDTGAVCRRAAWGLSRGPCGNGATGPDTVGAHPDGASPLGIHDLAGNVAEWVEVAGGCDAGPAQGSACLGVVRGGSYDTDLATELRTWVRREVPATSSEATIGFRCAYDVTTP